MAKLPKAVQAQVERVNELTKPKDETTDELEVNEEEVPAETEEEEVEVVEEETETLGDEPEPQKPTDNSREEYWEQRLKTVQGMHDADRRRAKEEAEKLSARVKELESSLKQAKKAAKPEFDLSDILSQDELELHDKDTIDLVRRSAAKAAKVAAEEVLEEVSDRS